MGIPVNSVCMEYSVSKLIQVKLHKKRILKQYVDQVRIKAIDEFK